MFGLFAVSRRPARKLPLHIRLAPADNSEHYCHAFCHLSISGTERGIARHVMDFIAFAASWNGAVAIPERGVLAVRLEVEGCECNSFTGFKKDVEVKRAIGHQHQQTRHSSEGLCVSNSLSTTRTVWLRLCCKRSRGEGGSLPCYGVLASERGGGDVPIEGVEKAVTLAGLTQEVEL